jgi:N-acetyl-gamma-glutamyl-phosphate reductase
LIAPLVRAACCLPTSLYGQCRVGLFGRRQGLIERFEEDRDIAFRAYGLGMGHKHVPEMTRYAGLVHEPCLHPA